MTTDAGDSDWRVTPFGTRSALTERQHAVLELVARDMRNKEIGRALSISEDTVKKHISEASRRLGTDGRVETAIAAGHPMLGRRS